MLGCGDELVLHHFDAVGHGDLVLGVDAVLVLRGTSTRGSQHTHAGLRVTTAYIVVDALWDQDGRSIQGVGPRATVGVELRVGADLAPGVELTCECGVCSTQRSETLWTREGRGQDSPLTRARRGASIWKPPKLFQYLRAKARGRHSVSSKSRKLARGAYPLVVRTFGDALHARGADWIVDLAVPAGLRLVQERRHDAGTTRGQGVPGRDWCS